jgi:predicted nucleotidyltransferase
MDIADIKSRVIQLKALMEAEGIHFDGAILFGSHAKGTAGHDSDVDLAILSRDFGKDRFEESALLNRLAYKCIPFCDALPVGLEEYCAPATVSPILNEVKKHGLLLF